MGLLILKLFMRVLSVNRKLFVATAYPVTEFFDHRVVRDKLTKTFDIHFDQRTREAILDQKLKKMWRS